MEEETPLPAPIPAPTGKKAGKPDYEVGYGKPPKDTRFGGPRAPRRGRKPKNFDQLRELTKRIFSETRDRAGKPMMWDGKEIDALEMAIKNLIATKPERALEIAFGPVPPALQSVALVPLIGQMQEPYLSRLAKGEPLDVVVRDWALALVEKSKPPPAELKENKNAPE